MTNNWAQSSSSELDIIPFIHKERKNKLAVKDAKDAHNNVYKSFEYMLLGETSPTSSLSTTANNTASMITNTNPDIDLEIVKETNLMKEPL